jgi:hypothetical protein
LRRTLAILAGVKLRIRVLLSLGVVLGACASWASIRQDAVDLVQDVAACKAGDSCVSFPGIEGDCTGVLGCPFPERAGTEQETSSRGKDIVDRSRSTRTCAVAFCAGSTMDTAVCDVEAGRCVFQQPVGIDAGPSLIPPASDAAADGR